MSEQLALDILKIVVPVVAAFLGWQQWQIKALLEDAKEDRAYTRRLLEKCLDDDRPSSPKKPWE